MRRISCLAEGLLAFQEGLVSRKLAFHTEIRLDCFQVNEWVI